MPDASRQLDLTQAAPGANPAWTEALAARFVGRTACIAVVGLGYAGLPMALALAEAGFPTLGLDAGPARIACLAAGETGLSHLPDTLLRRAWRFQPVEGFARLAEADAVLICVPTPLAEDAAPDLSALQAAARSVAWHLHPGQLVVVESTSWPGTTREVVQPILEATGLQVGRDVFLAFSPEREDPGNRAWRTAAIPRLVAGADPTALHLAETLYTQVVERVVPVESLEVAEAAKLTENVFRAVNIALANELKLVFAAMGIDVWRVMQAAGTKPFGFLPFWPGPGLGGHCIPVDPAYLTWQARRCGVPSRMVQVALDINAAMPLHILARLADAQQAGKLSGQRVLVLGVAYKPNIADVRESPGLQLMALIEAAGGEALYHDPHVPEIPAGVKQAGLAGRRSVPLAEGIARCGSALIVTDHDAVDYAAITAALPVVVDTRNVCARLGLGGVNILAA